MSNKVKDIDIKKNEHTFFNHVINKIFFSSDNIKIDGKRHKDILIYYIGSDTIKGSKYVKINSVNPLYYIFSKVNEYFEDVYKNKFLTLVPTNKSIKENTKK